MHTDLNAQQERIALIAALTERVATFQDLGVSQREAIRIAAREAGLTAMAVRRLIDRYPEA